ncbi:MAG: hypothetical protein WCT05_08990, partial [Lentisphaeria bacterium]
TPKKFRVQFLVMQKSSKSLKIRIMKSIFSNFHPQIMVKKLKNQHNLANSGERKQGSLLPKKGTHAESYFHSCTLSSFSLLELE